MTPAAFHRCIPRTTALTLLSFLALAGRASAQTPVQSTWSLQESRGSFCIWYLVEPAVAGTMVESGTRLRPAGDGKSFSSQIARVVKDEPKFAQWIPAAICLGLYGSFSVDGKEVARAKGERPLVLLTSMIAADGARGVAGSGFYLVNLGSDDRAFARAAQSAGFNFDELTFTIRTRTEGAEPEVTAQLGKTTLIWSDLHPHGESSVGTTRSVSFGYAGARNSSWKVALQTSPAKTDTLIGAFRVLGKDRLAKALLASPIREVSSRDMGGQATLTFTQQPRRP